MLSIKTILYIDCRNLAYCDSDMTQGLRWVRLLFWCLQMEYSFFYFHRFAQIEVLSSWQPWHTTWHRFPLCPQKQKLAKARRESETQRMTTMTTMMKTTIKSKTENESLPSYPSSPTNPNVRPPTTRFVIHVYSPPPSSELFLWGKTVPDGWAKWSCPPSFFSPPTPWNWEPPNTLHLTHPTAPRFSGSPALSIPQFHCRSLFMYSRVRTLGLVSSFGSVLLIFCWKNYFLLLGLLFLIFCLLFFSVPYFSQ